MCDCGAPDCESCGPIMEFYRELREHGEEAELAEFLDADDLPC